MNNMVLLWLPLGAGVLSVLFAIIRYIWVANKDAGNSELQDIAKAISDGAMAFLKREYKILAIIVVVVAGLLTLPELGSEHHGYWIFIPFILGAIFSAVAGYVGMKAATKANSRTANAAQKGIASALEIAFTGGSIMGLMVVGLAVLGLSALMLGFKYFLPEVPAADILHIVEGFALGASSVALFARVGGGIFTKAADVGADLVGKVEAGIPEDDPRNPAVIADNVGDNVGDVAGLGSDLTESYIASLIGAMVIGGELMNSSNVMQERLELIVLPLMLAGVGIIVSIISLFFVRTKEGANPQTALNLGTMGAAVIMLIVAFPVIFFAFTNVTLPEGLNSIGIYIALAVGLVAGVLIGIATEYYTADNQAPVKGIAEKSTTGPATNIIAGLEVGMLATGLPVILLVGGIGVAYAFAGLYGISIAAVGMLSTIGVQLAVDAYGPIADNAGGLAEMAKLDPEVRERTDKLDAVGNTTAAIGKGFAIGSAAFTALALFVAFKQRAGIDSIDVTKANVIIGLILGGMLPYVFSSFIMGAVGRAAFKMIEEVRRQFREIKGILEGETKPDYVSCVDIATSAALYEMIIPGLSAVAIPPLVGYLGGAEMLGGVLVGTTVSGIMLALFMANSGGAWDNAKKHIEGGAYGGKGSEAHKASVIGDTVGDPFKDTAGPAMDILIKLMSVVSLILAANLPANGIFG